MSLQEIHADLWIDQILPFLPVRFILDYQLAPIWFKFLPYSYHSLHIKRAFDLIFNKRYQKNKSSLVDILLKIIDKYNEEAYGWIDQIIPKEFALLVDRLEKKNYSRDEFTFSDLQFIFEFVSRYNFIYLGSKFHSVILSSSEPFEFSWVYAVDSYYQTNLKLILRRLRKSSNYLEYIYSELESMHGCKRVRGQFFLRNGYYTCELYNGLFIDIKQLEKVQLDDVWAQMITDSFIEDEDEKQPVTDEYFLQRFFLPCIESQICFQTKIDPTPTRRFCSNIDVDYSTFDVTLIPSQNQMKVDAQVKSHTLPLLFYIMAWLVVIHFNLIWPYSNSLVFQPNFGEDYFYWKSFLFIISDILIICYPAIYILRSLAVIYWGFWQLHHITMLETLAFMLLFSQLFYNVKQFKAQLKATRRHVGIIPWYSKFTRKHVEIIDWSSKAGLIKMKNE